MNTNVSNHVPYSYIYASSVSGRIGVPVPPAQLPYSYFKHVAGVASSTATSYSLDKLKILDTLIERLKSVKSNPLEARESSAHTDPERIDALIEEYGRQLHTALVADSLPYAKPQGVTPGMLLSVAA
ncbi:MAG: hypothetical protein KKI09_15555 [Spirochaetes bacterium]|nr:hypothetical protein [Spirochaetota bacterium]MBU0956837.1 hypothetical protein [Spirochaetota bacterium]